MPVIGSGNNVYGGIFQAVASGSIANGKACQINSDGTVSEAGPESGAVGYHAVSQRIYMYYLATPFDPMSTTDGTYTQANNASNYKDSYYSNGAAGQLQANTNSVQALTFKPDGTKLFVSNANTTNSTIAEFNVGSPFDPSTLTFVDAYTIGNKTSYPYGMDFKPDGTEVYVCTYSNSTIHQWTLSTAWDISTASFTRSYDTTKDNYRHGIRFKPDGTKMYITGGAYTSDDETEQYTLSTAWDISTASYDLVLDHSSYTTTPQDILFNSDGTKFYVLGSSPSSTITEYSLSTAYALNSASYVQQIAPYHSNIYGFAFGSGGLADAKYIGISVGAVSDGETASIRVLGGLDTNQSGLTPNAAVYLALDGSMTSTNTGNAQVGWALSPTTVLIRGSYKEIL